MTNQLTKWSGSYLPNIRLPKPEYAHAIYQNLCLAIKQQDVLFLIIGKLLKEIKDKQLFKQLDFDTFTDFVYSEELGFSGESAWLYIRVYDYYIETLRLSEEYVATLPVSRLSLMIPVLKKISGRNNKLEEIEKLKALRNNDFLLKLRQDRRTDRPVVYRSKKLGKWIIEYYEDVVKTVNLGKFDDYLKR